MCDEQQLWTLEEVADRLRVPRGSIYAWRHKGKGPRAIRLGRHLRVREADLQDFLERNSDAAPSAHTRDYPRR